jgi:hypothetical protein
MKEDEIYSVFYPNKAMTAPCMTKGTVRPLDCGSYGPRQEKICSMAHAQAVYGHTVTQAEAMEIANSNDGSRDFFLQCAEKVQGCAFEWTAAANHREIVQLLVGHN